MNRIRCICLLGLALSVAGAALPAEAPTGALELLWEYPTGG